MNSKELYEKYAGRKAESDGRTGVVCGYSLCDELDPFEISLIMAVCEDSVIVGWDWIEDGDVVVTHKRNTSGYHYVFEYEITPQF